MMKIMPAKMEVELSKELRKGILTKYMEYWWK